VKLPQARAVPASDSLRSQHSIALRQEGTRRERTWDPWQPPPRVTSRPWALPPASFLRSRHRREESHELEDRGHTLRDCRSAAFRSRLFLLARAQPSIERQLFAKSGFELQTHPPDRARTFPPTSPLLCACQLTEQ